MIKKLLLILLVLITINLAWAADGIEILEKRTQNSKTYSLGGNKFALDSVIGALHYKEDYNNPQEQWKDIELTWENNKITKAPYELTLEGSKITVRDKKTGEISTIELLDSKPAGINWEIVPENTRVSFRHTLPSDKVPFEAKFKVTGNIPLKTRAFDDEGETLLETTLEDGILTEKLAGVVDKETGKVRLAKGNIRIDPTLDLQVGAGAGDGYSTSGGTFSSTLSTASAGRLGVGGSEIGDAWARFTGISGLSGATIDVSYASFYEFGTSGSPLTKIFADDQAAPSAPTTAADHAGRTRTTAGVDWDGDPGANGFHNTPSLNSVIQELANSYDPSVIQLLHDDDGSANFVSNQWFTYNASPTFAPKLHIEYTAGGAAARRIILIQEQE